ncbi:MAG: insulinase family protein [Acidobacteria bacterium]|nr:insulinase family protein [Acidobacteriota bacterium]
MLSTLTKCPKNVILPVYLKILICIVLLISFSTPVLAQQETDENPFANFETIILPNGLKIWYKYLPNDTNVSISVNIPYGSDQDPIGKEELAHFTEHMLFSDHLGRTEEQIKKEIEDLGGIRNAITFFDHTFYFVRINKKHAPFALDWLYKVISPHEMNEQVVERQREPIALEVGARPRELFDWIKVYYLSSPWLKQPDFWGREFGEQAFPTRDDYPYQSLNQITAKDLKEFYDTYYTPTAMTLTIIGDIDRSKMLEQVNATFANLASRTAPQLLTKTTDPGRFWQQYKWDIRPSVSYYNAFKIYNLTQKELLGLMFISQFLQNRLNDRLRFGDRKATYGFGVSVAQRSPIALLQIYGNLKESEYNFARELIDKEIEALRKATLTDQEFETEKAIIIRKLKVTNSKAQDLENWANYRFYNTQHHKDFPDVVKVFEAITKTDIETLANQYLVNNRQMLEVSSISPLSQGQIFIIVALLLILSTAATKQYLLKPLNMSNLRYVARFQMSLAVRLLMLLGFLGLIIILGQIFLLLYHFVAYKFTLQIENFWLQWLIYSLIGMIGVFLFITLLAYWPSKLLLFKNAIAIKYLSYRAVIIPIDTIKDVSLQKFPSVWLSRRLWKCLPLTLGLFTPGIYLNLNNGWSYFFQIRDKEEFLNLLTELQQKESKQ